MRFTAMSKSRGSIGAEMERVDLVKRLIKNARSYKGRKTPREVAEEAIDTSRLCDAVQSKWKEYLENLSHMDHAGAIRYTANFYKKGLRTFIPTGALTRWWG